MRKMKKGDREPWIGIPAQMDPGGNKKNTMNTPIRHNKEQSQDPPSHKIAMSAGSILAAIAGGLDAVVNSTHHQAVEHPGKGLDVIARAPDGIIESISGTNREYWILGAQWHPGHPESSFAWDDFSRKLFAYFLARCRAARGMDEGTHTQNP